jgi:membrane protease YdiL (CAAX protease family)
MDMMKKLGPNIFLFLLGFLGVLSIIPLIPQLLAAQPEKPPLSVEVIQLIVVVQSSVLLIFMVWVGSVFSNKVGLKAPVVLAILNSKNIYQELRSQIVPSLIGGVVGGILLLILYSACSSHLPSEFITAGEKLVPPWYTKILYGGITEEILIRWGLMSFFVWVAYRITQKEGSKIQSYNYVLAIFITALIFGAAHLPLAFALSSEITVLLVTYIILGNAAFGFIAGYLYWKRGLECAIGAHMVAHVTMIVGVNIV